MKGKENEIRNRNSHTEFHISSKNQKIPIKPYGTMFSEFQKNKSLCTSIHPYIELVYKWCMKKKLTEKIQCNKQYKIPRVF